VVSAVGGDRAGVDCKDLAAPFLAGAAACCAG
jgi:hypothetical protein